MATEDAKPLRKVTVQQMKRYLATLGVHTEVDFENDRLYVTTVYPSGAPFNEDYLRVWESN